MTHGKPTPRAPHPRTPYSTASVSLADLLLDVGVLAREVGDLLPDLGRCCHAMPSEFRRDH